MWGGLDSAIQLGLLFAVPALAVAFSFRVIGFPDLTPDGSFVFGAALGATLLRDGHSLSAAFAAAMLGGAAAGLATAGIHLWLRVSKLLSGILVMTMLYSLSLRVMGTSNIPLLNLETFFALLPMQGMLPGIAGTAVPVGLAALAITILLKTELGILLRAAGDNESALALRGIRRGPLLCTGLALTNALAAAGGLIIAQYQGFVDISMGIGLVIICLAAIVIGEILLRPHCVLLLITAPILGMLLYQGTVSLALRFGLPPTDLKVATALLALAFIALDRLRFSGNIATRQIGNHNV